MTKNTTLLIGLRLIVLALFIFPIKTNAQNCTVSGEIIYVTNTLDSGLGSLRRAIDCANAIQGPNSIHFNIQGNGAHTIYVGSTTGQHLPTLTDAATIIDGSTQSGFTGGAPRIILDGGQTNWTGPYNGLFVWGDNCEIYGLTLRNFPDDAIDLYGSDNSIVGAPGKGNVIYNNGWVQDIFPGFQGLWNGCGIVVRNGSDNCKIQSNYIGTDHSQSIVGGNEYAGIIVLGFSLNLEIGGSFAQEGNIIANNLEGININGSFNNTMRYNHIYCNSDGGIVFSNNGNNLKAPPTINSAITTQIQGAAPSNDRVDIYLVDDANCQDAPCQGRIFLGSRIASQGSWQLNAPFANSVTLQSGMHITAIGTSGNGSSSTFSNCLSVLSIDDCADDDGVIWVTNADDDGEGSLRKAIECANFNAGANEIKFNIPGANPHRIYVGSTTGSPLPFLLDGNTILDATTQPGFGIDENYAPQIILDGSQFNWIHPINALLVRGNYCEVYGLEIVNFPDDGIDVTIGDYCIIGAPNKGNVIYNNGSPTDFFSGAPNTGPWNGCGIVMKSGASFTTVQGNIIGTDYSRTVVGGNEYCGVIVQSNGIQNQIGGDGVGEANVIVNNEIGVRISNTSFDCRIEQNEMYCNSIVGILLLGNANGFQPAPTITDVTGNMISGKSNPNDLIEVFVNDNSNCATAPCQGKVFLGTATANADSIWTFNDPFSNYIVMPNDSISATATSSTGSTSPFSNCMAAPVCGTVAANGVIVSEPTCGLNNGSVVIFSSSGTAPFSYDIGNGTQVSSFFDNLAGGEHNITVTDVEGCNTVVNVVLALTTVITATIENVVHENCDQQDGGFDIIPSDGTAPYTFDIGNGFSSNASPSNLAAGNYIVTVTDANGCSTTQTTSINNENILLDSPVVEHATCGLPNGSISFSTSGGSVPLSYDYGNGATSNNTLTELNVGTYFVTVTDANGCSDTQTVLISGATALSVNFTNISNTTCGQNNGGFTMEVTGGTSPYTFDAGSGSVTTSEFTNMGSGEHTVVVTDANGCSSSQVITLTDDDIEVGTPTTVDAICGEDNGSVTIGTVSGSAPFMYDIGDGAVSNNEFTGLAGGSYVVTITDANGCSATSSFAISTSNAPSFSFANISNTTCGQNNGGFTIEVTGGTSPYTFDAGSGEVSTAEFMNIGSGEHIVVVTDANGCSSSQVITLTDDDIEVGTPTTVDAICGEDNGSATITGVSGSAPYMYDIGDGAVSNNEFTGLAGGSYVVTITDANGCSATSSFAISTSNAPSFSFANISNTICGQNTGSFTVEVIGGTSPYTYNAGSGNTTEPTFTDLGAGDITVVVTDVDGCSSSQIVSISETNIEVSIQSTVDAACGIDNGSATVQVTTGSAPFTYDIGNGVVSNNLITGLAGGNYVVTVTDSEGCSNTSSFTIGSSDALTATFASISNANCGQIDGGFTVEVSGGTTPYTYNIGSGNTTTSTFDGLEGGTYDVTVVDTKGCMAFESITLTSSSSADISVTKIADESCGQSNGSFEVNTISGTSPFTFNIGNGTTSNNTFSNLNSGSYTVTATDANGCISTESISLVELNGPQILSGDLIPANCGQANGAISITVSGGTPTYTYDAGTGAGNNNVISGLLAGAYTVTVTDSNGCTDDISVTVMDMGSDPTAGFLYNEVGMTVSFSNTSTNVDSYQWDFGDGNISTLISPTHIYAESGTYTSCLTVTNECGSNMHCETYTILGSSSEPLIMNIGELSGVEGDTLHVPVTVENFEDIVLFQKSIHLLDPDVAKIVGVSNFNLNLLTIGDFSWTEDVMTVVWIGGSNGQTVANGTIVYTLDIVLKEKVDCSSIVIDGTPTSIQVMKKINGSNVMISSEMNSGEVCGLMVTNSPVNISGEIAKENGLTVANVEVNCTNASTYLTLADGQYDFMEMDHGETYTITPFKDGAVTNGVTGLDMVMIQQHILGTTKLDSPYKIIAGDANHSETVSTMDLVMIQSAILGNVSSFNGNTSWRFVPKDYEFSNPQKPFDDDFPESITLQNLTDDALLEDFVAIKIGDVNLNANPNIAPSSEQELGFVVSQKPTGTKGMIQLDFKAKDHNNIAAWQLDLSFDHQNMVFEGLEFGDLPTFSEANIGERFLSEGLLPMVWVAPTGEEGLTVEDGTVLFSLKFELKNGASFSNEQLGIKTYRSQKAAFRNYQPLDVNILFETKEDHEEELIWEVSPFSPNPFSERTQLVFNLPTKEKVQFQIFDLSGKIIYHQEWTMFEKGKNKIEVKETFFPSTGVYYYRMRTSQNHAFGKLAFTK